MNEEDRLMAMALAGGLLGRGYNQYPVLGLGEPSGASYPAAAEAAEGYAGALGFNIGPEGGLVYRPWEAEAWKQSGIDPNLWNAPFAGGGLLGGGYPGGGFTQPGFPSMGFPPGWTWTPNSGWVRTDTTADTTADTTGDTTGDTTEDTTPDEVYNPFRVDPNQWTPPYGFVVDPVKEAGGQSPFMQWTIAEHQRIQDANAAAAARAATPPLVVNRPGEDIGVETPEIIPRTVTGNVPTVRPSAPRPLPALSRIATQESEGARRNRLASQAMNEAIARQKAANITSRGTYAGMPVGLLGPR